MSIQELRALPVGKTCKDCVNFQACHNFYKQRADMQQCRFIPNQFKRDWGTKRKDVNHES